MKNDYLQRLKYIFWDVVAAIFSYTALYYFRQTVIEKQRFAEAGPSFGQTYLFALILIAGFWVTAFWITGFYKDIYRRSRLKELIYTFNSTLLGCVFIFFALMLNDWVNNFTDYYRSFLTYFGFQFFTTALLRFLISTRTAVRIKRGKIWFNTILVGSNENAVDLYTEMASAKGNGNKFVGFVSVHNNIRFLVEKNLKHLGPHNELNDIIKEHEIEEVIIASESSEHGKLEEIINNLEGTNVTVKMIPDTYDIISGKVRLGSLGAPLIEIRHELMPLWQRVVKRIFDIVVSLTILALLSPLLIFTGLMVKFGSPGPIFFRQRRMGNKGKYFDMIKFRSMFEDAEKDGPQLSSKNDARITGWGRFMRKYRLDELPQFMNVLFGQMSIVGPRPERKHYIDLISKKAPHYKYVLKVKPGITSWGMVKFGYAENVDEMIQRLKYDIIYIENMNLFNDLKILIYTVLIVLQGRGK